jgi:hypothetical protein
MTARILLLVGSLVLGACKEQRVSSEQPAMAVPSPTPRLVYLLRRVAVATEESLYGLDPGSELKVIEERSGQLLVETQGVQFEISQRDATNDPNQVEMLLAGAEEEKAIRRVAMTTRLQIEDQKFLAEENARRRSLATMRVAHLRNAIDLARTELARLEAESVQAENKEHAATKDDRLDSAAVPSREDHARRQRIFVLQTHIANCEREIHMLSDAMAAWE